MNQGPQHKTKYLESDRRGRGDKDHLIDTRNDIQNRALIMWALMPTVDRWDLMKFKSFWTTKDSIILRMGKIFASYLIQCHYVKYLTEYQRKLDTQKTKTTTTTTNSAV